jgi:transposase
VPTVGPGDHRRAAPRLAGFRAPHGPAADCPGRAWPAPDQTRSPARGQGVLPPPNPLPPAATRDQGHHPRKERSARNTAERAFNKLKEFRAVATRTDKREFVYQGTIDVASIKIWLRNPTKQDPADTP